MPYCWCSLRVLPSFSRIACLTPGEGVLEVFSWLTLGALLIRRCTCAPYGPPWLLPPLPPEPRLSR
jgi:hypothetical protein